MKFDFFVRTIYTIAVIELFSLIAYLIPAIQPYAFAVIGAGFLIIAWRRFDWAVGIGMVELIIGSKGYLFALDLGGTSVSIRMAFWLIILAVYLSALVLGKRPWRELLLPGLPRSIKWTGAAFLFALTVGAVRGLIANETADTFFDLNNWLYLAWLWPLWSLAKDPEKRARLIVLITAACAWVAAKTLAMLFVFSHFHPLAVYEVYRWLRVSGVGEITDLGGGYFRIFFQSHVFLLVVLLALAARLSAVHPTWTPLRSLWRSPFAWLAVSAAAATLVSFSRSNWLGLAVGLLFVFALRVWRDRNWQTVLWPSLALAVTAITGLVLAVAIVSFPYPKPTTDVGTVDALRSRTTDIGGSAVSSRQALFGPLKAALRDSPIFGHGFGATVTYVSDDPRIRASNPTGVYTTYAFEWGWLDLWYKLGLWGALLYAVLIGLLIHRGALAYIQSDTLSGSLAAGLVTLAAIHMFSPYLNHPLGIGYLCFMIWYLFNKSEMNSSAGQICFNQC